MKGGWCWRSGWKACTGACLCLHSMSSQSQSRAGCGCAQSGMQDAGVEGARAVQKSGSVCKSAQLCAVHRTGCAWQKCTGIPLHAGCTRVWPGMCRMHAEPITDTYGGQEDTQGNSPLVSACTNAVVTHLGLGLCHSCCLLYSAEWVRDGSPLCCADVCLCAS